MTKIKRVYSFGNKKAEGDAKMKELLGGKGANLAEMAIMGLPVPAGFTITTDTCTEYYANNHELPEGLMNEVWVAMEKVEADMGMKYDDPDNALLVSCRSGARSSMPGMMDTVLNIGLSSNTIPGLIKKTNNPRFVYDSYRRLIMMYADVVMDKAEDLDKNIRRQLDDMLEDYKHQRNYQSDTDLSSEDLMIISDLFKKKIKEVLGVEFPDDAKKQLEGSIKAVFKSWNGKKAISYRRIESIPDDWGTAVNVQAMVFGNMGESSATGVAFTRNPATGENLFYGEWLVDAQGEDVVAGIRTPSPLNNDTKNSQNQHLMSMQDQYPAIYKELDDIRINLEDTFKDMLDIEFTVQEGKLYMLQCRVGKRTGTAALNMAMEMLDEGRIDEKTAILRVNPAQLDELLHPIVDPNAEKKHEAIVKGLPAGPGAAVGKVVFTAEDAVEWTKKGEKVILLRKETNPEDVEGMRVSDGLLTALGGMTSHAALVARGWGKCCIVGCDALKINTKAKTVTIKGKTYKEGDVFSLNGSKGLIYDSAIETMDATENPRFVEYMTIVDKYRVLGVRTNADTPEDALNAINFGAEGIGLFRIEHMFYGINSEQPLAKLRKVILSENLEERVSALAELEPYIKETVKGTLKVMDGKPVTFRLLDPPLHEFVPQTKEKQAELAKELNISLEAVQERGASLHEVNPMMGHRGVRLGITYPEISEAQMRAIFEATAELIKEGFKPQPELMVPVTISSKELDHQKVICDKVHAQVEKQFGVKISYLYGTMIEIPRAAMLADEMAKTAQFFSFGTNDLTQMTYGFSRDDIGGFMNEYLNLDIIPSDPFQTLDQGTVG
ncbi:MAG: pyruvate, phosphate dikinase, partial [Bacteroidales bacterium]|nr:pyruvate, phosphate dikinase [Bacteroidales bacterium]